MFETKLNKYRWFFVFSLGLVHGVIALWHYPPFFERGTWLGASSISHIIVSLFLIIWVSVFTVFIALFLRGRLQISAWDMTLSQVKTRDTVLIVLFGALLSSACLWVIYALSSLTPESQIDNYIRIIEPLLFFFTFIPLEIVILIFLNDLVKDVTVNLKFSAKLIFVLFLLGILSVIIISTKLGIVPSYIGDWSRGLPAVPLFEWHIFIASGFSLGMAIWELNKKVITFAHLDLAICFLIWIGASLLWISQPIVPNASALKPHEPNFEIYPFLDSQTYDQLAQSVLVGKGFNESIPPRSLYITFLVISHVLVGQSYEAMIKFQLLVFAIFPVLLYIFGTRFFGRPIGISIAILAILRDFTSNLVSPFTGNLSYSKVFMSEIPTAMLLILLLIMGYRWIREEFPVYTSFLMGGILGLVMLIRTQASVALPVIVIFGFLVHPRKLKPLIVGVFVIVMSLLLATGPWLWRNWRLTGDVIFDSPEFQTINLAIRYSRLNGVEPGVMPIPDESYADYNERLKDISIDAIRSNPRLAVWGVMNTFLNHGVNNILLFPLRYELASVNEFWIPKDAFWEEWEGKPSVLQSLLLFLYLFLFGLGVAVAWHRNGWLGLMPLGLNFTYNLWTSLALLSGQRFMVSMDWSIYYYYMIGIFSLVGSFGMLLARGRPIVLSWAQGNFISDVRSAQHRQPAMAHYFFAGLFFLLIGSLPPLVEKIIPEMYPPVSDAQTLSRLLAVPSLTQSDIGSSCLKKLNEKGSLYYVQGRALYPRYYVSGDGEKITDAVGYKIADEDRIVFEFVGQINDRIVFPVSDYPVFFPHASDVTLVYGEDSSLWFVYVKKDSEERFYTSKYFNFSLCK